MNILENIFKLKENQTNIKTELIAGMTTFFTMSYLFILSPKILTSTGLNFESTLCITALIVFIGSVFMGLYANKPYAVAPFLGETAFISYTICASLGFSIKSALAAISLCGLLLFIMTIFNLRTYIIDKIPETIKITFCVGLGLFFIFIALKDIGIVNFTNNPIPLETGNFTSINIILGILSFILLIILAGKKIKGAILISILTATLAGIILGDVNMPEKIISLPANIAPSILQVDFSSIFHKNFIPILFVIFLLVNIDTSGALISLKYNTDNDNNSQQSLKRTMICDSVMVILAPLFGTTTPGAYIDSMTGIKAGGRTGLSAITVGGLFLLGLFFTPLISIIPSYAYAPALLYIGIIMTTVITKLDFNDITEYSCAILTFCIMIFTYNIGSGIIAGFVIYPLLKLFSGQKNKTNLISWILFVLSIAYFIIYPY